MSADDALSLENQIACVKREVAMRERVYPAWVRAGKMTEDKARHELAAMRATLITLEFLERHRVAIRTAIKAIGDST